MLCLAVNALCTKAYCGIVAAQYDNDSVNEGVISSFMLGGEQPLWYIHVPLALSKSLKVTFPIIIGHWRFNKQP